MRPVPAFTTTRRRPRHLQQVLLGETLAPADEEGGNGAAVAVGKSATTLVTFGAFDKQASRIVSESGLLSVPADRGGVEKVSDLLIGGHITRSASISLVFAFRSIISTM